jgi:hypothetical protein
VPGAFRCCGNKLEPERLQPKINLRIHQTTGMNRQEFHLVTAGNGFLKPILQNSSVMLSESETSLFIPLGREASKLIRD